MHAPTGIDRRQHVALTARVSQQSDLPGVENQPISPDLGL